MLKLDPIERVNFALSAGSVGAACALASPGFATGLAVGVVIEAVNLRAQVHAARDFFARNAASPALGTRGSLAGLGVRFVAVAAAIIAALQLGVDPLGMLVGLSLAMPAVVFWAWRNRPPVVTQKIVPALAPEDPSWDRWSVWRAKELLPDGADEEEPS